MMQNQKNNVLIILALILLLGSFLRIYMINDESFWLDETGTATAVKNYEAYEIIENVVIHGIVTPGYFPGDREDLPFYFVLLSFWSELLGVSEFSLRLFSALFGSLSIIMVFFVAKEITNRNVALLSSFIFSLSMVNIEYSQEARLYSFMLFIALASVYFFIKAIKTGKLIHLSIFTLITIVGLYTHFLYLFFMSFQGLYTLLLFKSNFRLFKRLMVSFFLIGLSYLPAVPRLFQQGAAGLHLGTQPIPITAVKVLLKFNTWIYPSAELQSNIYAKTFFQIATFDWLLIISALLLALLSSIFFIMGIVKSSKLNTRKLSFRNFKEAFTTHYFTENKWTLLLVLWFFIPFLLEFFLSILHPTATIFGPISYLLFTFPAYLILISIGILSLRWRYAKIIIILFVVFSLLPLISYYININKQQWREVALYMKDNLKDEEIILINSPNMNIAFDYYYGKSNILYPVYNATQAAQAAKNKDNIWLILSFDKYFDPEGTIRKYLETQYLLDKEENFFDIKILHYNRKRFLATES